MPFTITLLKLVLVSLLSVNHYFLPHFGNAIFLLSPQSRFQAEVKYTSEEAGRYYRVRFLSAPYEAAPEIDPFDKASIKKQLLLFKESGNVRHLSGIIKKLTELAQQDEAKYQKLKEFLEDICLVDSELLPFDGTIILYSPPYPNGNQQQQIELAIRGVRGIFISKVSTPDALLQKAEAIYSHLKKEGKISEQITFEFKGAVKDVLARLGERVTLSAVESVLDDETKQAQAIEVIGKLCHRHWGLMDKVIFYEGSHLLEIFFRQEPVSCFMKMLETIETGGIKAIDENWINSLPMEGGLRLELSKSFPITVSLLLDAQAQEGWPAPFSSFGQEQAWRAYVNNMSLADMFMSASESAANREKLGPSLGLIGRSSIFLEKAIKAAASFSNWVVINWLKEEVEERGIRLKVKDGKLIPANSPLGGAADIRKIFGDKITDAVAERGIEELVFERGAGNDYGERVISLALDLFLRPREEEMEILGRASLGLNGLDSALAIKSGKTLTFYRIDPYDDRLYGRKAVVPIQKKPVIIYSSAYFNENGTERFPDARAARAKLIENTIPFLVDEDITAEEALRGLYNWAIKKAVAIPSDGRIPVIIPEEAKSEVMGQRLPDKALLVMVQTPGRDEVIAYKVYRVVMAILYGDDVGNLRRIISEEDEPQNEALRGEDIADKDAATVIITPVSVGPTYLEKHLGVRRSS